MGDKDQAKRNVRDVTSAWEAFRNMIHRGLPGSAGTVSSANQLAAKRRGYG